MDGELEVRNDFSGDICDMRAVSSVFEARKDDIEEGGGVGTSSRVNPGISITLQIDNEDKSQIRTMMDPMNQRSRCGRPLLELTAIKDSAQRPLRTLWLVMTQPAWPTRQFLVHGAQVEWCTSPFGPIDSWSALLSN